MGLVRIRGALVACAVIAAVTVAGCGSSGITAQKLNASIAPTFANLYVLQQSEEGFPRVTATGLASMATCQKGTTVTADEGAGPPVPSTTAVPGPANGRGIGNNWRCYISYFLRQVGKQVTVGYDVDVQSDGCYAASSDGPTAVQTPLGVEEIGEQSMTITPGGFPSSGPASRQIPNPLWLINGCFSVT